MQFDILFIMIVPVIWYAFKKRKWYLYLTFAFIGVLPDTFAFEISPSLPLLTVKRMVILLLCAIALKNRRVPLRIPQELKYYFTTIIMISIVNVRYGFLEFNKLSIIILEQLILIVLLFSFIRTKKEIEECIDFFIAGAVVQCFIGIFQTVLHFDVAEVLMLVNSRAESGLGQRMGVDRAAGTLGAFQLGSYCTITIFLCLYKYETKKAKKYVVAFTVALVGLICTMSRSALVALILVLVPYVFDKRRKFFYRYGKYIMIGMVATTIVIIKSPHIREVMGGMIGSMVKTLGGDVVISEKFGENASGFKSRLIQWTSFYYMFKNGGLILGFGYQAYARGMLHYFMPQYGVWVIAPALDVGAVGIVGESGIVGLFIWLYLVFSMLIFSKKHKKNLFLRYYYYLMLLYLLLNVFTSYTTNTGVWLLWGLYFSYKRISSKKVESQND